MTNQTENPTPNAQDDIKTVLQDVVLQNTTALLKYTNTEAFALQVPDTETHIMAGPRERIAAFLGLDAPSMDWRPYHSALSQCAELLDNMQDGDPITMTPVFLAAKLMQMKSAGAARQGGGDNNDNSATALASQSQAAQPSIDSLKFRALLSDVYAAYNSGVNVVMRERALITYIDSHLAGQSQATKVQAVPYGYHYEWAACITTDGPQRFKWQFDKEPPPQWAIEEGQARNVTPLFDTAQEVTQQAAKAETAVPYQAALLAVERMRGCSATYIKDHAKDTYPGAIGLRPQDVATMWAQEIHGIDAKVYLDEAIADLAPTTSTVSAPKGDAA